MTLEQYASSDVALTTRITRDLNIGGRKLATIRRITDIQPIEGADRIVVAVIDGWQVVTQKDNFKVGDLCVYFEIDSFLPVEPRYEFLRKAYFRSTVNLGDGFRIKTIRLRGQLSQGLALPLHEFPEVGTGEDWDEGCDLTDLLGLLKWEVPGRVMKKGDIAGAFPHFIPKTDQERAQNLTQRFNRHEDEFFEVTVKLDGSSMTVYRDEEGNVGVCSRNISLKEDYDNIFWRVAKESGVLEFLRNHHAPLALQGELMGPGTQGNREKLSAHAFFLFDIYDIAQRRYLLPDERRAFQEDLRTLCPGLRYVPVVSARMPFRAFNATDAGGRIPSLLAFAEGGSLAPGVKREGVVFKSLTSTFTFKVIANSYLLAEA